MRNKGELEGRLHFQPEIHFGVLKMHLKSLAKVLINIRMEEMNCITRKYRKACIAHVHVQSTKLKYMYII